MLLLFVSFAAGVLTVLAPCTLPLLPVIIGGSVSGGVDRKKALTITLALGLSVILFTLILKVSTAFINIPQNVWSYISGTVIVILGLSFIFPRLWENSLTAKLSIGSNKLIGEGFRKKSFWGDVLIGAALGPVFSSCSPTYFIVIATVLPAMPLVGMIYLLVYTFGLCIALFVVSLLGQKLMAKLNVASDSRSWFKKVIGILFILVGVAIFFGLDKASQSLLINSGVFDITKVEQKLLDLNNNHQISPKPQQTTASSTASSTTTFLTPAQKAAIYPLAPELTGIDGYINTGGLPITIGQFKGKKVVLLDIWTYSCINCQRTLPYLKAWYDKYKDQGLEIIGLHTPEFAFEHLLPNVEDAVKKFGLEYPVVLDNEYATWNAYGNQYWPNKYLIDIDGYVVYEHAGEGDYDKEEQAIQKALAERNARLGINTSMPTGVVAPSDVTTVDASKLGSPETYFGSNRNEFLANGSKGVEGEQKFVLPSSAPLNNLLLGGDWYIYPEFAETLGATEIEFTYKAKNVYMVGASTAGTDIQIYRDGVLVGTKNIKENTLYQIISNDDYNSHTLLIKIPSAGLDAYTFTFG